MDLTTIFIIVAAACGIVYFFPRVPRIAQIVVAVVGIIACMLVLLNFAGIPVSF
jgi:hypothetical protein